ncbi:MAG TPA: cyclopropane-fatty-acyl-phospholipid synthase family protein [Candidatus Polarisedimenticolaceae bacterium]|nr:cyclopropane-fatty-acyl-phospholipid synthase family protein [Candidatus Polarisedimenticolaceae bacterium]
MTRAFRALVHARLARLTRGSLTFEDALGTARFGEPDPPPGLRATIRVHDLHVYRALVLGGSVAAGEAYVRGDWTADDLVAALRVVAANPEAGNRLDRGVSRLGTWLHRLRHRLHPNSRKGSRANIAAHYDQGNDFFASFLDPTLSYSCSMFPSPQATLEEAAVHKLDLVCHKLGLRPGQSLLEIGTGWGGLALHAASRYGCSVTTTTISGEQARLARERVAAAGLQDRVEVLEVDYRDLLRLGRRFDRLVSVEMIEAVGAKYLGTFFDVCGRLLRPEGRALIQAIVISEQSWERYRRSADFIQRHVFPGGCLPSIGALCRAAAKRSPLRLTGLEDFTPHYAATLAHWRRRLHAAVARGEAKVLSPEALRSFDYYFAYCEAGFRERLSGLVQMVFRAA